MFYYSILLPLQIADGEVVAFLDIVLFDKILSIPGCYQCLG